MKFTSRALWLVAGILIGMLIVVLAYEAGLRTLLWQHYDIWRFQRQTQAGLAQTPIPEAQTLTRTEIIYPDDSVAGFANDRALFMGLADGTLTATREAHLADAWQLDSRNLTTFQSAVESKRVLLRDYLGPMPAGQATISGRQIVPLPVSYCAGGPSAAEQLTISSRFPGITLTAYLVLPVANNNNGRAVVALHGHGSSPERMLGLEPEDHSRLLALRLACAGYTVIIPAITSDGAANSAISARLTLEGATLYGLMVSHVSSSLDVIQAEYPDRAGWPLRRLQWRAGGSF